MTTRILFASLPALLLAGCQRAPAPASPAPQPFPAPVAVYEDGRAWIVTPDSAAARRLAGPCDVDDRMVVRVSPDRSVPMPNARPDGALLLPPKPASGKQELAAMPNACASGVRVIKWELRPTTKP